MTYRNILLIDDDADDHEIFMAALAKVSAEVVCEGMTNASEALEKLAAKKIIPDVIFLDLNMPIMNGQQFLYEIKRKPDLAYIPVVIFSTSSHPGTIQLTKEMGAMDFITKPDKFNDLVSILERFLM